jgi:hypothetical protein
MKSIIQEVRSKYEMSIKQETTRVDYTDILVSALGYLSTAKIVQI